MAIVVHVTAVSHNAGGPGSRFTRPQSAIIQDAMLRAARECRRNGVTNPDAVKAAMLDAREQVKRILK